MQPEKEASGQIEAMQSGRTFIGQARRAQIIENAIEVIAAGGYARASLAEIAKRAGISKGVISYHFSGKEELMEQVVAEVYLAGIHFMAPRLQAVSTPTETLRAYIESNVEFIGKHRKQMMALFEIFTNLRAKDEQPHWDASSEEPILASLEAIFADGQRSGEFRSFVPRVMAITIRRAIDAVPPQLVADPSLDAGVYGRELATIFELATRKGAS